MGEKDPAKQQRDEADPGAAAEGPKAQGQTSLAQIWQDALGVTEIDENDAFFALGGQSLLAVEIAERAHHELGAHIPLEGLLDGTSSIQTISDQIGQAEPKDRVR